MSEAWERVRRRHALVVEVLDSVADAHGTDPATAVTRWRDRIDAEYGDDDLAGFLRDVQRRWQRTFEARLDAVLEQEGSPSAEAVAQVWRSLREAQPATRLVLDAHAGHPAVAPDRTRQRATLLAATGVDLDLVEAENGSHGGGPEHRAVQACPLVSAVRRRAARRRSDRPAEPQVA